MPSLDYVGHLDNISLEIIKDALCQLNTPILESNSIALSLTTQPQNNSTILLVHVFESDQLYKLTLIWSPVQNHSQVHFNNMSSWVNPGWSQMQLKCPIRFRFSFPCVCGPWPQCILTVFMHTGPLMSLHTNSDCVDALKNTLPGRSQGWLCKDWIEENNSVKQPVGCPKKSVEWPTYSSNKVHLIFALIHNCNANLYITNCHLWALWVVPTQMTPNTLNLIACTWSSWATEVGVLINVL